MTEDLLHHAAQRCWLAALSFASGRKPAARSYLTDATIILHGRRWRAVGEGIPPGRAPCG